MADIFNINMKDSGGGIRFLAFIFISFLHFISVFSLPEQGIKILDLQQKSGFTSSMYNQSRLTIKLLCPETANFSTQWSLVSVRCANSYTAEELTSIDMNNDCTDGILANMLETKHVVCKKGKQIALMPALRSDWNFCPDSKPTISVNGNDTESGDKKTQEDMLEHEEGQEEVTALPGQEQKKEPSKDLKTTALNLDEKPKPKSRRDEGAVATAIGTTTVTANPVRVRTTPGSPPSYAAVVPEDGVYVVLFSMYPVPSELDDDTDADKPDLTTQVTFEVGGEYGYLSAIDWPLLPFYRIMFVTYFFYSLIWLVFCCCYRKDLLQVQYWIAGVIFIGLLEKSVFLGEYETLNKTGQSVYGAVIFGELVSAGKRMLARMLVVVVSVGFGIVKPRLGRTLYHVLAVGLVYYILGATEAIVRITHEKWLQTKIMFVALVCLCIVDVAICYWIFSALVQTMRTLRIRRNVAKLSLYRHFTNTLIFAVLASLAFMIWSMKQHKIPQCLTDWKELWVDEAFWHLLFSVLLFIIMMLWRPAANNQRYAYSPLTDAADDEAEEPMMNDAFDGMKLRSTGSSETNLSRKSVNQNDDDLKWVDDNIPKSIDTALPSLLDSDEEIETTMFELNKMQ